jgi:protein-tyrosine phosphatase
MLQRFTVRRSVPIGILFVCTANICRSPMAEGVFRSIARRAALVSAFSVDTAGTFDGYVGKPPARAAIKAAALRGYDIRSLRARQVVSDDIARFDHVIAMDRSHLADLRRVAPRALIERLRLFTDFDPFSTAIDVADPYGGDARDFDLALDVIEDGCDGILKALAPLAAATA